MTTSAAPSTKPKSNKISELTNLLEKKSPGKGDSADSLSKSAVAAVLFRNAPAAFLEQATLDSLTIITERAQDSLNSASQSNGAINIKAFQIDDGHGLAISLGDRPFIVNTLREALRAEGAHVRALLHPIISDGTRRLSLSYAEIDSLPQAKLQAVTDRIMRALSLLESATDDYSAMLVRAETLIRVLANPKFAGSFSSDERGELGAMVKWLIDGAFIFLGYREMRRGKDGAMTSASALGILKSGDALAELAANQAASDAERLLDGGDLFSVSRLGVESEVQRRTRLTNISIIEASPEGSTGAVHSFVGLFTSKAAAEEASSIPVIRRRLAQVLTLQQAEENSHDFKYITDIVNGTPKEELLCFSTDTLSGIVGSVLSVQNSDEVKIFTRDDDSRRSASILVVMPKTRLNSDVRDRIQGHIERVYGAPKGSCDVHVDTDKRRIVRLFLSCPIVTPDTSETDADSLTAAVAKISQTWESGLESAVFQSDKFEDAAEIVRKYSGAFPEPYQSGISFEECLNDIRAIESLSAENPITVRVESDGSGAERSGTVVVCSLTEEITISKAVPILENAGLEVVSGQAAKIDPVGTQGVFVHRFAVLCREGASLSSGSAEQFLAPGLSEVFLGRAESDNLNSLLLSADLDVRTISLLRTYCALGRQVMRGTTRLAVTKALAGLPKAAKLFAEIFDIKFNPKHTLSLSERQSRVQTELAKLIDTLRTVSDITADRVLRTLANILEHTVRTNFYLGKPVIALKIHSAQVSFMPQPRPLYEIFLSSPVVEGVHLRSGMVARGGIRFSDRPHDFRSEVLGLMKTQKIKNVVIVPTGAKGGFILRRPPTDKSLIKGAVEDAYREFIRALLSVTDNRKNGKVVHPTDVLAYDGEDPYFVVAADKGTATFSDIANSIAVKEYDFWLGDAFASGGSNGYDHKLYGITARGAWECVKRHFNDLGMNFLEEPFTAVGIGDMSGDVFGNGLILSDKYKLLAAFNHKHIFIDPSPDAAISYEERVRLFNNPGLQWSDYNSALISKGGGIFGRFDKEIELSPEARAALGIDSSVPTKLNGEQVISIILKAPCDLIWNGGIGTYFKSALESNADVEDGANDRVRIDAEEIRARVIGEGGNLGFTPLARAEFALRGGRINTDAIDNSGGVDLSDHEVNIKILCSGLMKDGKLGFEERNKLLKDMAHEVCDLVLEHNRNHALLLSSNTMISNRHVEYYRALIRDLVKMGYVNRALDFLPDDDELTERAAKKTGLASSELAVCLGMTKMWLKDKLLQSAMLKDPLLSSFLVDYFPSALRQRYETEIKAHPLSLEIIATQVTNSLVDCLGITFVHRVCSTYAASPEAAMKCALAAELILGTSKLRSEILKFDTPKRNKEFLNLFQEISRALRDATVRLLSYHSEDMTLKDMVELYAGPYKTLCEQAEKVLIGEEKTRFIERRDAYLALGLEKSLAQSLALSPRALPIFEILWTSHSTTKDVSVAARVFSEVMDLTGINSVLRKERTIEPKDRWEQELLNGAYDDIRRRVALITSKLINNGLTGGDQVTNAIRMSANFPGLGDLLNELRQTAPSVGALSVLAMRLRGFEPNLKP